MKKLSKKATATACSILGVLLVLLIGLLVCKNTVEYEFTTVSQLDSSQLALLEQSGEDWGTPVENKVIRVSLGDNEVFLVPLIYANISDVGYSGTPHWTAGVKFLSITEDSSALLYASDLACTMTVGENTAVWYSGASIDSTNTATQHSEGAEDWCFEFALGTHDSTKAYNVAREAVIEISGTVRPKGFPFNLIKIPFDLKYVKGYTENAVPKALSSP